jgi:hypothetical protein
MGQGASRLASGRSRPPVYPDTPTRLGCRAYVVTKLFTLRRTAHLSQEMLPDRQASPGWAGKRSPPGCCGRRRDYPTARPGRSCRVFSSTPGAAGSGRRNSRSGRRRKEEGDSPSLSDDRLHHLQSGCKGGCKHRCKEIEGADSQRHEAELANEEISADIHHNDQKSFATKSGSHSPPDPVPREERRHRVQERKVPCVPGLVANEKIENTNLTMNRKNLNVARNSSAKSVCTPICTPLCNTGANVANGVRPLAGVPQDVHPGPGRKREEGGEMNTQISDTPQNRRCPINVHYPG